MSTAISVQGIVPNPTPEQPPGTEGLLTVLNWISWIVIIGGVAAFLVAAGTLAWAAHTGRESNSFKGLLLAIVSGILAAAAGGIMQIFV
ncbi:hypothetical protein [Clavibacter michiganensis]|uniref:hypothetical protein n=1 Tax=Clavibacter michiganensis TaxID=28447 RepID=UPI00215732E4|nr:hypothetical protein [Clavibacter michiganensis]